MPYPNEHACRLAPPDKFQKDSFRRITRGGVVVIIARPIGSTKTKRQSFRYPKSNWTADRARAHCKRHKGKFEAAKARTVIKLVLPRKEEWWPQKISPV